MEMRDPEFATGADAKHFHELQMASHYHSSLHEMSEPRQVLAGQHGLIGYAAVQKTSANTENSRAPLLDPNVCFLLDPLLAVLFF